MKKLNLFKYGLTALMMAFAMTLCYSCSSDDDEENGENTINGHAYVELAGIKWATENVGKVNGVEAMAGPDVEGNEWGCYFYTQNNAEKAAESWGGTWKLPTRAQWQALIDKCYWEWTNDYDGKSGYIVYKVLAEEDKGQYSYNYTPSTVYSINNVPHIFLPAAGYSNGDVNRQGNSGNYCPFQSNSCLIFCDDYRTIEGQSYLSNSSSLSVRPVSD